MVAVRTTALHLLLRLYHLFMLINEILQFISMFINNLKTVQQVLSISGHHGCRPNTTLMVMMTNAVPSLARITRWSEVANKKYVKRYKDYARCSFVYREVTNNENAFRLRTSGLQFVKQLCNLYIKRGEENKYIYITWRQALAHHRNVIAEFVKVLLTQHTGYGYHRYKTAANANSDSYNMPA